MLHIYILFISYLFVKTEASGIRVSIEIHIPCLLASSSSNASS